MSNSETNYMRSIMVALSKLPCRVFRNNVGLAQYPNGTVVKYGLCPGSSDLIGWTTITITPDMVGKRIATFTAIEVKTPNGIPSDDQITFVEVVQRAGGIAGFAKSDTEALTIIQSFSPTM